MTSSIIHANMNCSLFITSSLGIFILSNTEFSGIFLMMWVVMMISVEDTNSLLKVFLLQI